MVETYPYVFEFTVAHGLIVFDFPQNKILLRLEDGEREFPAPVNLHNFCVVMGGILYGKKVSRKQVFFTGKPGERKVIELRGFLYEKMKKEGQSQEVGNAEEEKQGEEITQNGENPNGNNPEPEFRKRPRALITFIDEPENFKRTFLFNVFNLYALWELFRLQNKVVSVDDLVFERRDGNVLVQGVPLPFQKAKALFYALDLYLRTGQVPAVNQDWEYGRLMLWNTKKRMDFFRKNGEVFIPSGVIRMSADNALRIMSVL